MANKERFAIDLSEWDPEENKNAISENNGIATIETENIVEKGEENTNREEANGTKTNRDDSPPQTSIATSRADLPKPEKSKKPKKKEDPATPMTKEDIGELFTKSKFSAEVTDTKNDQLVIDKPTTLQPSSTVPKKT